MRLLTAFIILLGRSLVRPNIFLLFITSIINHHFGKNNIVNYSYMYIKISSLLYRIYAFNLTYSQRLPQEQFNPEAKLPIPALPFWYFFSLVKSSPTIRVSLKNAFLQLFTSFPKSKSRVPNYA